MSRGYSRRSRRSGYSGTTCRNGCENNSIKCKQSTATCYIIGASVFLAFVLIIVILVLIVAYAVYRSKKKDKEMIQDVQEKRKEEYQAAQERYKATRLRILQRKQENELKEKMEEAQAKFSNTGTKYVFDNIIIKESLWCNSKISFLK